MMIRQRTLVLTVLAVLAVAIPAQGATHFVPGSFATIQGAVNASSSGDVVSVSAGTYYENVAMKKGVQLIGAGPASTVIDGSGLYTTVTIPVGATPSTRLEGFTIRNGNNLTGGGVRVQAGSSPTISNCWIEGNHAGVRGGGIYADNMGEPIIEFCRIIGNDADEGGGIFTQTSNPTIRWNVICGNHADISGGGIHIAYAYAAVVENNTIINNSTGMTYGAGITSASSFVTFTNNIIAGNTGGYGYYNSGCEVGSDCNIWWGNPGGHFLSLVLGANEVFADPEFCDTAGCDVTVSGSSPAVSNEHCGLIGAETVGCGFTSTESESWGAIKRKFR
ncbi:MAG: right-handed parallel beta-helix repeat-containing protein [Candidatus Eisenbacteria bacterium]